ncbi:S8 family peptidase [Promicromonospora iranensis]|uniref:S8 family peptidase n=1 Tax=Promicromonospora iranensis TaxID=1105144 RepID=UPI0023A99CEB|nr:S8/S53 family peptidase [Promicromonospora iranensis]
MPESELRVRDHFGTWRPARDLDPAEVTSRRGGRVMPTQYVSDRLIVRGRSDGEDAVMAAVRDRAQARGLAIEEVALQLAASREGENPLDSRHGVVFQVAAGEDSVGDGDAWDLMDEVAEVLAEDDRSRVSLDHLVVGHQKWEPHGPPSSRSPASFLGPAPLRAHAEGTTPFVTAAGVARPVVAVLDSGIGAHPWFEEAGNIVIRDAMVDGEPLGTSAEDEPLYDCEVRGRRRDRADELDTYAGHGTFIAGVVHQVCPDAAILPVRVFGGDGRVSEWDLARTLEKLLEYHLRGIAGQKGFHPVDVVVLSAGFYAEHPEDDDDYDGVLRGRLRDLRRVGVLVVLSAGNDGSARPTYPAAWAPKVHRTEGRVVPRDPADVRPDYTPLLAVTAMNPDGSLADFSNDGPWVTAVRNGVRVVSSMPTTFDGAQEPWRSGDGLRQSLDPDNFVGGFGTWSGTSFAAPTLAGELARAVLAARVATTEGGNGPSDGISARVAAAWNAVAAVGDLYVEVPAMAG